jgi:hypothetical protein
MVATIAEGRKGRKQGSGPVSGVSSVASLEVEVLEFDEFVAAQQQQARKAARHCAIVPRLIQTGDVLAPMSPLFG